MGEVRGAETRTLLDSLNTGHSGSLATIHANSAANARGRFANLVLRGNPQMTYADVEAEIGEAVDYVAHLERNPGRRVIREVLSLDGYDRRAERFETIFSPAKASLLRRQCHAETRSQAGHSLEKIQLHWVGIVSRKAIASGIYLNVRAVPHSALDTHAHRLVYGFQQ